MAPPLPTWAVVATVDEAPELTCAFAGWHLALGAAAVHLYLDRPDDPVTDRLRGVPGVTLTRCDRAYWRGTHGRGRPYIHMMRQRLNATHAYRTTPADWLIHIDADEFLAPEATLADELAQVPAGQDALVFLNDERAFLDGQPQETLFSGQFRRRLPGQGSLGRTIYGSDARYLRRGFTGHTAGKTATRTGRTLDIGVHKPFVTGSKPQVHPETISSTATRLLHFEGITPLGWTFKRVRKAHSIANRPNQSLAKHRTAQISYMLDEAVTAADFMAFHDRLCLLGPDRAAALEALDLLYPRRMDFAPAEAALGQPLDLSPARFDAWLWETKGPLLEDYGFSRRAPDPGARAATP